MPEQTAYAPLPRHISMHPLPVMADAMPLMGLTILTVEDSRYTSDILRLMCQRSGARFRRAENCAAADSHLRLYRPDVAIVDMGLPDGRGEDLIRRLVAMRGPVVFGMSGNPDERRPAQAAGAVAFLEKPLPDLSGFQAVVLMHMHERRVRPVKASMPIEADLLALRDDLAHAQRVLYGQSDQHMREWLAAFLAGIARQVCDPALAAATDAMRGPEPDIRPITQLLRERINRNDAFAPKGLGSGPMRAGEAS